MTDRTTPLPWRISEGGSGSEGTRIKSDAPGARGFVGIFERRDDAAMAVRRVNAGPAADALADALGRMMDEHTALGQHENGEIEYCQGDACANAALALAAYRATGEK